MLSCFLVINYKYNDINATLSQGASEQETDVSLKDRFLHLVFKCIEQCDVCS